MNRSDFGGLLKKKPLAVEEKTEGDWARGQKEMSERASERKQDREQSVPLNTASQTHINSANTELALYVKGPYFKQLVNIHCASGLSLSCQTLFKTTEHKMNKG